MTRAGRTASASGLDRLCPRLVSAVRRTARIAIERPRAALWTTLALTCALFAVAVAAVAATSVERWTTERPGSSASMVVYLGDGVDDARAAGLVAELRAIPGVERAELVPSTESARRLVQSLGSDAALLEGVDVSSLPASVEVTLEPGVRDVIALSPIVHQLRGTPGVAELVVDDPGDDRIAGALATVRAIAWSAAALFAGLALITVIAAIRVRLDRDRRELAVVELLGGGPSFFVVPTALAGALQGLAASLLALAVLALGLYGYGDELTGALATSIGPVELAIPGPLALVGFAAAGALLGLVGGALAGASRVAR